ncbi:MAG: cytochrome c oxidase subunit 3 family protein [Pyrinomonadaceae bacterium]
MATEVHPSAHHDAHSHEMLAHHFDNMEQQREASALGMWVFLVTEIMFFGGLFLAYTLYRGKYPEAFEIASNHLDWRLGGFNTVVLIVSSLTMALAVWSAQVGKTARTQLLFLGLTALLGATFLGVKAYEYHEKYVDRLIPIRGFFRWGSELPANVSEDKVQMFYFIYFSMTGLHALHMVIGLGLIAYIMYWAWRGRFTPEYHGPVEIFGLYWHFVDIVWIFLFPLLYLLGAHYGGAHH